MALENNFDHFVLDLCFRISYSLPFFEVDLKKITLIIVARSFLCSPPMQSVFRKTHIAPSRNLSY